MTNNMNKLITSLIAALLCVPLAATAKGRSPQEAHSIAKQFFTSKGKSIDIYEQKQKKATANKEVEAYYIFTSAANDAYVIISGDDRMREVLGYGDTAFDIDSIPEGLQFFLDEYATYAQGLADGTISQVERYASNRTSISPLLGDIAYDQEAPYNKYCPSGCPTGCVATAVAQVMAYYKYPDELMADIPSYTTKTKSYNINGYTHGQKINWNIIRNSKDHGRYSDWANEIATVMAMVGASMEMDYAPDGSAASVITLNLANHFGYNYHATKTGRGPSIQTWEDMLYDELQAQRPVLYEGRQNGSGHQFVCDGYDANQQLFHFNWGWGGSSNGYYTLDCMGYSSNQILIKGFCPAPEDVIIIDGVRYAYTDDTHQNLEILGLVDLASDNTKLNIAEGTLRIPAFMFQNFPIKKVTIPESVTSIGLKTFLGCPLEEINFNAADAYGMFAFYEAGNSEGDCVVNVGPSVKNIQERVFQGSNITRVNFFSSNNNIAPNVFYICDRLNTVACYSAIPPTGDIDSFPYDAYTACTLYVPAESLDLYKKSKPWKWFSNITSGINAPTADSMPSPTLKYLDGNKVLIRRGEDTFNINGQSLK